MEKIRISEICSLAEVERPTFYYHFKDKYDLLAWIFCQSSFHTSVISLKDTAESLNQLREDFMFYKRAYEDASQNALWKYMREYYIRNFIEEARRIKGSDDLDPQLLFGIRLYCYGASALTWEWLLYDNKTSAEAEARLMFASMPDCMKDVFFSDSNC